MRFLFFYLFISVVSSVVHSAPTVEKFTQGMEYQQGFYGFFYDKSQDRLFLEIKLLSQPFIMQTSLPRGVGSNDIGLDRGQLGNTRLVQFERFGNKIMLNQLNTDYRASSHNAAEKLSIDEAFADSVLHGFSIVAESNNSILIDYTPYLLSDVHGISARLSARGEGNFKADKSRSGVYLPRSKGFPENTELEAMITFVGSKPGKFVRQVTPQPTNITVHLHHSFVALPDDNYKPRRFSPMSGYWAHSFQDYSAKITEPMRTQFIRRHRLKKKNPSAAMSEAVEPIIYYLDPGIPEPVMSALKDGTSWWNQAFENIGYKDAFQVKVLPEGADPMDVRYNVINWVHRATRGWSYGSSVVDPRTGEILKGHVTLGSLRVRQDYLIALGLTSPFKGDKEDSVANDVLIETQKSMAIARIRQLAAHEVGHTLGIAHNFAASEYGRQSVMDYPHPRITLKNGEVSLENAYSMGMGKWDLHAIEYGYQDYTSFDEETKGLVSIISNVISSGMRYKSDPDTRSTVHGSSDGHLWDNGSDPIEAFNNISLVRSKALKNLGIDTLKKGQALSSLQDLFVPIYLLHRYQIDVLAKQIGGVNYQYERKGDFTQAKGQTFVSGRRQKESAELMIEASKAPYLSISDTLIQLITPPIYGDQPTREHFKGRTGRVFDPVSAAETAGAYSLSLLLHPEKLNRLSIQHDLDNSILSPSKVVKMVLDAHFYRPEAKKSALTKRLRLVALNVIMKSVEHEALSPEVKLALEEVLLDFTEWLEDEDDMSGNRILLRYFNRYWKQGVWPGFFDVKPMPPGSPI